MGVVAGIDEAGLGPVLGPLVVSGAAFELPDELMRESLWGLLAAAVCKKPARRGGKIAIGDSKKLFSRRQPAALVHLERGTLGMLATRSTAVRSLRGLLNIVAPASCEALEQYPWYRGVDIPLANSISSTELTLAGNSLLSAMKAHSICLLGIRSEPIFVGQFNRHVAATNNKSTTLFDVTARLLVWLWSNSPGHHLRIIVDRHGGRMRYLPALQRVFDGCSFKILDETDRRSSYRITGPRKEAEICFITNAESAELPVALASMVSKYLRELFMIMLNQYWTARVPDLAPTAGYYTDGRRFFQQIAPAVRQMGVDQHLLYRTR